MAENKNSIYVPVNLYNNDYPEEIENRTYSFNMDINTVINDAVSMKKVL